MLYKNKNYKKIFKAVGEAVFQYGMISSGERIALALSGGKDSLTLLRILKDRQRVSPIPYSLHPIYIDPGFEDGFHRELEAWCRDLGFELRLEFTLNGPLAHSSENRKKSPCFLCALLRRKKLFDISRELGCKTLALGHNKDDIIETLFINMCYSGKIGTMLPRQEFFKGNFHLIRPLALVDEQRIISLTRSFPDIFPVFSNPCPSAGQTRRSDLKLFLHSLYSRDRKIKSNIFRSMANVRMEYMLNPKVNRKISPSINQDEL